MNSKFLFCCLFYCLVFVQISFSQFSITGKVYENEKPFSYMEVVLYDSINTPMRSVLTDVNGIFSFKTEKGNYRLEGRFLGNILFNKNTLVNADVDLGRIDVEATMELEGVVITARRNLVERKVDRLVFNVGNSIAASGGDALDALKVTPGIIVNNDQISIIGKSGVAVMVNDRIIRLRGEDVVNYLKSISSDDIQKIEVITAPPSKYDAEGMSGLINIVLKREEIDSWSNSIRSSYIQTTYPSVSLGNTFNYSKNNLNLRASVAGKMGNELVRSRTNIRYPNQEWVTINSRKYSQNFVSTNLMADYSFTDNSKLGFQYLFNNRKPDGIDNFSGDIFLENDRAEILSTGNLNRDNITHSFNLHYYHTLDTIGRKIGVELDYVDFKSTQDRNFLTRKFDANQIQTSFLSGLNDGSQRINIYSARVHIEHPNKWFNLTYGGKISTTRTDNNIRFFDTSSGIPISNLNQTDHFVYSENTLAAYINANKNISEKWRAQLGIRYEHTQTIGESIRLNEKNESNYSQLFPTLHLQHAANENNVFNVNYSRRINRPAFWELNPFRWYTNQFTFEEGNPFLQPSFADNIELTHAYKNKLFTSLFFQNHTNVFGQVPLINENTFEQVLTRKNYYDLSVIGLSAIYVFNKYDWWQSQNTVFAFYTDTRLTLTEFNIKPLSSFAYILATNNSFVLNRKRNLTAELNFLYNSPKRTVVHDEDRSYSLDFGFRYFLLNRDLQLSFVAIDILGTSFPDIRILTNDIPITYNTFDGSRNFRLSVVYRFGNRNIQIKERDSDLEEKRRINTV